MFNVGAKLKIKNEYLCRSAIDTKVFWAGREFQSGNHKGREINYPTHSRSRGSDLASHNGNNFTLEEDSGESYNEIPYVLVSYNKGADVRLFPSEVFEQIGLSNNDMMLIKEYEI